MEARDKDGHTRLDLAQIRKERGKKEEAGTDDENDKESQWGPGSDERLEDDCSSEGEDASFYKMRLYLSRSGDSSVPSRN